jgi:LmbE family N-acetylglucosaminyl deacetylase
MMQEFERTMRELGADWDEPDRPEDLPPVEIGLPDEDITTWVDITDYGDQKYDALAAHASQTENIFFLQMGKERFMDFMGVETFVRVRDRTGAQLPEGDLFDGLRETAEV